MILETICVALVYILVNSLHTHISTPWSTFASPSLLFSNEGCLILVLMLDILMLVNKGHYVSSCKFYFKFVFCIFLPQDAMPTGCCNLWSPLGGRLRATIITEPWVVPTSRQGLTRLSVFLGKLSQKWKEEMASRDSRSMLATLELRERVNELSLASGQQEDKQKEMRKQRM